VKLSAKILSLLALAVLAPMPTFACATCYGGNIDSPMTDGMNLGIFTLLGVVGTVLASFLAFLIFIFRKSAALAAANNSNETISKT
jgi:hypothetical protein